MFNIFFRFEALIIMAKEGGTPEPGIPSVFASQKSGVEMSKMASGGAAIVRITPVRCQKSYFPNFYMYDEDHVSGIVAMESLICLVPRDSRSLELA